MSDAVNHPQHYNRSMAVCDKCGDTIECIEVVRHFNFNLGNVIKYIWRAGLKENDGIEDLKKAVWYLQDEINWREKDRIEDESKSGGVDYRGREKNYLYRQSEQSE